MARYRIDLDRLEDTLRIAADNADRLGVRLLLALKGFPLPAAFPTFKPFVQGVSASGLYEAKMGALMGRDVHVHAPAYTADEMSEIRRTCSHVVFNSLSQLALYGPDTAAEGCHVGLRINPGFSSAACLKYDPCCPDSRFGVLRDELEEFLHGPNAHLFDCVDGLHIHALCEGYSDDFAGMVERFTSEFASFITPRIKWINLGGGEVINRTDFASPRAIAAVSALKRLGEFEVLIEPSEYLVRYSGFIDATVLDVIHREKDIAILDMSGVCHATDLVIYDMKAEIAAPPQVTGGRRTILGTVSCLAGDVLGEYEFVRPLQIGDTVTIGGMGCYSFAQQSWFNGVRHPDIVVVKQGVETTIADWTYTDYLRDHLGGLRPSVQSSIINLQYSS